MGSIPDVQGYHNLRVVAAPGAGNEFEILPLPGVRMRIISVRFRFAADATVVNRTVGMHIRTAVVIAGEVSNQLLHGPGLAANYCLWPGYSGSGFIGVTVTLLPWTGLFIMDQAFYLQSFAANLQAGDAYTDIAYATEEWISEP